MKKPRNNQLTTNHINRLSIIVSVELIVFGLAYLLAGLDIIPISIKIFWLPLMLGCLGVVFMSAAVLRKDIFAAWLSVPFLVSMILIIIVESSNILYSQIYPFFIAIPGMASLVVLPFTKARPPHIKSAAFFIGIALVFLLDVWAHIGWGIIIAVTTMIIGILLLINSLVHKQNEWEKKINGNKGNKKGDE